MLLFLISSPVAQIDLWLHFAEPQVGPETLTEILSAFLCFPHLRLVSWIGWRERREGRIEREQQRGEKDKECEPPTAALKARLHY